MPPPSQLTGSQGTLDTPPHTSISSSFPLSSPSAAFWDAAATIPVPSPTPLARQVHSVPIKRSRDDEDDHNGYDEDEDALRELQSSAIVDIKRVKYTSPTPVPILDKETETSLSYLPNRTGPIDSDDPHAYLANAEYAPNKFGDIGDYMRKKEIKVQTQNRDIALAAAQTGLPQIFKDLSFYINGNTHPPMEELRKMILQRGGEVRPVLRNKGMVKFIIAPMLTQSKFKQFANYRVVREGWIIQSCEKGKLLDWSKWKLQIQGGWEESGRKGMEGFLNSQVAPSPSQIKSSIEEKQIQTKRETSLEPKPPSPTPASTFAPNILQQPLPMISATSRGLLTPIQSRPIPITPKKEASAPKSPPASVPTSIPANVQKTESPWEFYHSKESNKDAAQAMKNDEWRAKNTAERGNEGGFIDGYYQNSRLHHLSTWKAELKVLVADAQRRSEELSMSQPSTSSIAPFSLANSTLPSRNTSSTNSIGSTERTIFHVDFDCFFVSCGLATRPHLKGKPTVVCHSQAGKNASSTSEIASCSYEARAKGVKNGMSLGRARTLVGDDLQTIPYEFETYKKFSLAFYTILMSYADELQAVSVDEALIDVTSAVAARAMAPEEADDRDIQAGEERDGDKVAERRERDPAVEIAEKIRNDVRAATEGCEVSIGISHNILLAKLATRAAKPAGVYHLIHAAIPTFLSPLDVEDFPSIGYSIKAKIEDKFGSTKVEGLLNVNKLSLQRVLGPKTGDMLFGYLRGVDERKLEADKQRKSVSAEMNYGIRFRTQDQAEICVADLAAEVAKRMKNLDVRGRQLTLKLMKRHPDAPIEPPKFMGHGWCETFNKSANISNRGGGPTDDPEVLAQESVKLLKAMKLDPAELRGVGIQVTKLDTEKKEVERESGQGLLSFQPKSLAGVKVKRSETPTPGRDKSGERSTTPRELSTTALPPVIITKAASPVPPALESEAGPSRRPVVAAVPSSDGIDPDFLAALPPDLQQEVKRDYAQTRSRAASERPAVPEPKAAKDIGNRATTVSPAKKKTMQMHEAAHITRQLRPKNKTQMKVNTIAEGALYGAWARAQSRDRDETEADIVDLTKLGSDDVDQPTEEIETRLSIGNYDVSELKELGIDLDVFEALPEEMRKEVMDSEKQRARQRKILRRPGFGDRTSRQRETSLVRSRGVGGGDRTVSLSPSRSSRAGSIPIPAQQQQKGIVINRPSKPALLNATALPDILDTVSKWIESRKGASPAQRDVAKVKMFLLKCVEPSSAGAGLGGVEVVVEVLRWMRIILREKWAEAERDTLVEQADVFGGDGIKNDWGPGGQWWIVWKEMKDEVCQLAQERFGAALII